MTAGAPPRVQLERVAVTDAHEGPVYAAGEDALYFTTVRRGTTVAIKRLDLATGAVTVVRADANVANGMTRDAAARLLVCEQGTCTTPARIARIDLETGAHGVVVDAYAGRPLSSPNDVVVKSDGSIWFTDPSYGFLQGFRPRPALADAVYRFDPETGRLAALTNALDKPNGLAFSPDERVLYVGDSGAIHAPGDYDARRPRRVLAFDVDGDRLTNAQVFADELPGFPDGLKVDASGRVFVSAATGVLVFDAGGALVDEIRLPGAVNFAFGGRDGDVLYITADSAVWAAALNAKGA